MLWLQQVCVYTKFYAAMKDTSYKMDKHNFYTSQSPEVIYYDNHLVIVNKPSGLATHEDGVHNTTLRAWVESWIIQKFQKPGRAFVVPVHRLDMVSSGIVIFAKTDKALSRMMEIFRSKELKKSYQLQTLWSQPMPSEGRWTDYILREGSFSHIVQIHDTNVLAKDVQKAEMNIYRKERLDSRQMWHVELLTGRHHQIRAQFAHRGAPILGDTRYGGMALNLPGILLHHNKIVFEHPIGQKLMEIEAPLPSYWNFPF